MSSAVSDPAAAARARETRTAPTALATVLGSLGAPAESTQALGTSLARLIDAGADRLPRPGHGATLARWQALAAVAAADVQLVKLYEGHTDALAILAELDAPSLAAPGSRWGVWAAESRDARVTLRDGPDGARIDGRKVWCSGAAVLTDALLTAFDADGRSRLVAVRLDRPGVTVTKDGWNAIGMAATGTVDVAFRDTPARPVGAAGAYVRRPGFWHGGAGIAACWHGGAAAIALAVRDAVRARGAANDVLAAAHLGAIDVVLAASAALLRESAAAIDAAPHADAHRLALRTRLCAEHAATEVLERAGRLLGAGAYCRDRALARRLTDLRVFLRQSHAERDAAALGALAAADASARPTESASTNDEGDAPWML